MHPCVSILALRADINIQSGGVHVTLMSQVHFQVHVFDHKFATDFYGKYMNVLICGFLRYALFRAQSHLSCCVDVACPESLPCAACQARPQWLHTTALCDSQAADLLETSGTMWNVAGHSATRRTAQ